MGSRLVGYVRVEIDGVVYENGTEGPQQLESVEIEHRDDEASRLTMSVFDNVPMGKDPPYPEFNRFPNPRKVENITVTAWGGWEGEEIVKMFEGLLVVKSMDEEIPSHTKFVALHESYKLRRRAKSDVPRGLSVKQMLIRKGAEFGCKVTFDKSTDDSKINEPMEEFYQPGEVNWDLMYRYINKLGFVAINKGRNEIYVTRDKLSGTVISVAYGDDNIKRFALREENKKAPAAPKRRGHHHETIAGRNAIYPYPPVIGVPGPDGKGIEWREQPLAKIPNQRKMTLAKDSVIGRGKRLKQEGDEAEISERFRPAMINQEVYAVSRFGPDIDGMYQTSMVRHIMGNEWTTESSLWRP